ncbi:MAG: RsmE family RNA methyltransferase [Planctomycetota bacterium]
MRMHRFYSDSIDGPAIELAGTEAHHLAVLRLGAGDKVELFDGLGGLAEAVISGIRKNKITLQVEDVRRIEPRKSRRIIIAFSVPKGERFDWLIEKCTELGVERISPVIFERTVRQPGNPKALDRWVNLAISAAKQCGRLFLPQIDSPMNFQDCLESIKRDSPNCRLLAGGVSGDCELLAGQSFGENDVAAFVGPEGGITENEEALLKNRGVGFVRLSDTILRTETAAIAFASVLTAQREV